MGIDEVGRGPWAGPLVVGAVVLGDAAIPGLADSKKLTAKRREVLSDQIHAQAVVGLGWAMADEIDVIGLAAALRQATIRAVEQITVSYHDIILDGTVNFLSDTSKGRYVTVLPKADALIPAVSAASIVAKVARDRFMAAQDEHYPAYGFGRHVGYGTAAHRLAIQTHGVTPLHRLSFAPLAAYRPQLATTTLPAPPSTKKIGDQAETLVANWLEERGHQLRDRNWRTPFCEIDIVSQKNESIYVTEVKYRKTDHQGGGVVAISATKQARLRRAAAAYVQQKHLDRGIQLWAAIVVGEPMRLDTYLQIE